jgi:hypothetical protein
MPFGVASASLLNDRRGRVQGPVIGSSERASEGEAHGRTSPGPLPRLSIRGAGNRVVGGWRYLPALLRAAVRRSSANQGRRHAGQDARLATSRVAGKLSWSGGWNKAVSTAQSDSRKERHSKHRAAVTRSLQWSDEAARREDYADALGWLQAVEAAGDKLPTATRPSVTRGSEPSARTSQKAEVRLELSVALVSMDAMGLALACCRFAG